MKRVLDREVDRLERADVLPLDPVTIVREFPDPADQEVVGLLAAALAYGRVLSICIGIRSVLDQLGPHPSRALHQGVHRGRGFAADFQYRWTHRHHLRGLLEACARTQEENGGLGASLAAHAQDAGSLEAGLVRWIDTLRRHARRYSPDDRGLRFLLPQPGGGGASKRLRLFLRWMIRPDDGIDLGTWSGILSPADLIVPLDTHWIRIAPRLGLTQRRTAGGAMAVEITEALRRVDPRDPLRYDFVICHLGIDGHCPRELKPRHCRRCPLRTICRTGRASL